MFTHHVSFNILMLQAVNLAKELQRVLLNFWRMGSQVCSEFLQFAINFAMWLRSCQWSCELRGEVGKFVAKFGTKFGIEFRWSSEHSYEFFNPARKSHAKNRLGKNCRPLTGRQRTNTNWNISESWETDRVFQVLLILVTLFRKGEHSGWQGYFIRNSSRYISKFQQ